MHTSLDDRTGIVYSEIHSNEQAVTAVGFWKRANAYYKDLGIAVERVIRQRHWGQTPRIGSHQLWQLTLQDTLSGLSRV